MKSELPHATNYGFLLKAIEFMGCIQLHLLHHGDTAKYTSQKVTLEFLEVIGEQIEAEQLKALVNAPFFSVMVNVSTDVAILKELVIYCRYVASSGKVHTSFLSILQLFNGTAEAVEEALRACLEGKSMPSSHLVGFSSDGAAVMTGRNSGVAAKLNRRQPVLTSIHCIHRLALAAGQAGKKVAFISKTFQPTLTQLFYFYESSPVRKT